MQSNIDLVSNIHLPYLKRHNCLGIVRFFCFSSMISKGESDHLFITFSEWSSIFAKSSTCLKVSSTLLRFCKLSLSHLTYSFSVIQKNTEALPDWSPKLQASKLKVRKNHLDHGGLIQAKQIFCACSKNYSELSAAVYPSVNLAAGEHPQQGPH